MTTSSAHGFRTRAAKALRNAELQEAMARAHGGFVHKRQQAIDALPEFDALRAAAKRIKAHALSQLDRYLEQYESEVRASGGEVHWARNAEEACGAVAAICRAAGAERIIKGKSMVGEEMGLNRALESAGFQVVETDLGEYIVQLAGETPSHIIAPAVHKTRDQISDLFHAHHAKLGYRARVTEVPEIVGEARQVLRNVFLNAEVGITGANFLVAETGSSVLVTNEGNGDLASTLPRVHIVIAGIEKIVPRLEDAATMLRVLGRSATGQELTTYTTFATGPRRSDEKDGPEEYHVVLLDNGRSRILGSEYREVLHCIRCGACLNHCPVYGSIGGHAYGSVYSGPVGSVLTPLLDGLDYESDLPNACTLNGRCQEVCPLDIPLPEMLRRLRVQQFTEKTAPRRARWALAGWSFLARRPRAYRFVADTVARLFRAMGRARGSLRSLPLAGGWTRSRNIPVPEGRTFLSQWERGGEGGPR